MSDVDPTPSTPVTIGDRLAWFRTGVQSRLDSTISRLDTVATKLDALITAITAGGGVENAPIVSAIEAMRGGSSNNTLETLNTRLSELNTLLSKSNEAQGADPDDGLQLLTVRGLLYLIYLALAQVGIPPDSMDGSTTNSGTLSIEGTRYIKWPVISGLTRSESGTELTPASSWTGYEIYIQTSAPSAKMHNISGSTVVDPYPVNTWASVEGNVTYAWSVDASYQVVGYMRTPADFWIPAASVTTSGGIRFAIWSSQYVTMGTRQQNIQAGAIYIKTNLNGWTIRNTNSTVIKFAGWNSSNVVVITEVELGLNQTYTFMVNTYEVYVNLGTSGIPVNVQLLAP